MNPQASPRALLQILVTIAMVAGMLSLSATPASAMRLNQMAMESLGSYEPQSTCMPKPKPGMKKLAHWLLHQYPVSHFITISVPCGPGVSEHKEGRAFDWGVDVRHKKQRQAAYNFLHRIFATDAQGNADALARRMGIMYVIWNDKIYSSYFDFKPRDYLNSACSSLATCSRTNRHKNHMHISLTREGGWGQSSWYRSRHVKALPVMIPGTNQLDPNDTAYYGFDVPLDGTTVTSPFKFSKNETYTIYMQGLYRTGAGSNVADPVCRWEDTDQTWVPITTDDGYGLLLNGQLATSWFTPTTTYDWYTHTSTTSSWSCDPVTHSFTLTFTPARNTPLTMSFLGSVPQFGASPISVHIVQEQLIPEINQTPTPVVNPEPVPPTTDGPNAAPLTSETVTVPADAADGVLTAGGFVAGHKYTVNVSGTAQDGTTPFDAVCVNWDNTWEYTHTQNLTAPADDHLNLYLDGTKLGLHPPNKAKGTCNVNNHTYTTTFTATHNGQLNLRVWDPNNYNDNTGDLTVSINAT
jgi:hypothetical protein